MSFWKSPRIPTPLTISVTAANEGRHAHHRAAGAQPRLAAWGIDGTVTDASGAFIPRATVNITEVATSRVINLSTNEVGRFSVRNLVPGRSTIKYNWTTTNTVGLDYTQSRLTHTYRFGIVDFNNRIQSQELGFKFDSRRW